MENELSAMTRGLSSCDEAAWRAFHERCYPRLHGLAISRGVPACDAPEIIQGVYLRVLRHAKVFRDEDSFHAWLACLLRCEVIDAGRKSGRRSWLNECFQHWQESKRSVEEVASRDQLEEALLELDEKERALIRHHYLDGWSQETLAERHQVSVKAIESKLARLRKRLRQILTDQATSPS
jgi:RNA polymerase sigma-70 factor (ECF subfamily)